MGGMGSNKGDLDLSGEARSVPAKARPPPRDRQQHPVHPSHQLEQLADDMGKEFTIHSGDAFGELCRDLALGIGR